MDVMNVKTKIALEIAAKIASVICKLIQCEHTACSQFVDKLSTACCLLATCYKVVELNRLVTGCSNNLLSFCNSTICQQVVNDNLVAT
jgi:hypothetical protein